MNLREVREAAARLHNGWHSQSPKLLGDYVRNSNTDFLQDEDTDSGGFSLGSCELCGCNLYEDDSDMYCEQCDWWIENVTTEER